MSYYQHRDSSPVSAAEPVKPAEPVAAEVAAAAPVPAESAVSVSAAFAADAIPVSLRTKITFFLILFISLLTANFVLWSGFALGFFITTVVVEAAVFIILPMPVSKKALVSSLFFGAAVIALGATYFLYSDMLLAFLNFLVLVFLFFVQLLVHSEATTYDWDQPKFLIELVISPFARPFVSLPALSKVGKSIRVRKTGDGVKPRSKAESTALKILIGLLVACPFMIFAVALLSSADLVYKNIFQSFFTVLSSLSAGEIMFTLIFAAIIFPFLFSLFYSYQSKWKESTFVSGNNGIAATKFMLDSVITATVLFCVDILYGIFAFIQFSTLFGAFHADLPQNVTYAQYAREGFFQLAAIAFFNLLLIMLSVMFTHRKSISGLIVRVLSLLMIFFTFVQLASALYRMKMYIDAYALSKLRVLVTLFIGLIFILLIFALIKEFFPSFKIYKSSLIACVLVLILTNYLNTNARIAEYNTRRYLNDSISLTVSGTTDSAEENSEYRERIDSDYLMNDLSYEAIPYVIRLLDADDKHLAGSVKTNLLNTYQYVLKDYRKNNWKRYCMGTEKAKNAIESYFGANLEKELALLNQH